MEGSCQILAETLKAEADVFVASLADERLKVRPLFRKVIPDDALDLMTKGPVDDSVFRKHHHRCMVLRMNLTRRRMEDSLRRTKPDR